MLERIHLAIVAEVERQGSLTAAAQQLCLTQSALSHSMRKLEEQLGTAIWLREGEVKGETRLVLPSLSFNVRESLEFINEGQRYLLTPIDLEESGSNYEIGRYRESVLE